LNRPQPIPGAQDEAQTADRIDQQNKELEDLLEMSFYVNKLSVAAHFPHGPHWFWRARRRALVTLVDFQTEDRLMIELLFYHQSIQSPELPTIIFRRHVRHLRTDYSPAPG
jgi:hypothetical protein